MILQHRSHRLARALAAATAAAAATLAAPPALARIDPPATPEFNSHDAAPTSAPVVVRTLDDGFDWGAAAIAAGGAGAVVALAALAAFANTSRDPTQVAP
jgi:hypothetical protein